MGGYEFLLSLVHNLAIDLNSGPHSWELALNRSTTLLQQVLVISQLLKEVGFPEIQLQNGRPSQQQMASVASPSDKV